MKIYLCGAISHDPDANGWRRKMIRELLEHEFWNPLEKERDIMDSDDLVERFRTVKQHADLGSPIGLNGLRRIMLEQIIPLDIEGVTWADVLVCRVKRDKRMWGSICEIYEAYKQNKPVYLITDLKYIEMNAWEIALADEIWFSEKDGITGLRRLK